MVDAWVFSNVGVAAKVKSPTFVVVDSDGGLPARCFQVLRKLRLVAQVEIGQK